MKENTENWKDNGLPRRGWYISSTGEMPKGEYDNCDWCGTQIRFLFYLKHEAYDGETTAGCICTGKLTGDLGTAQQKQKDFLAKKRKAAKKDAFGRTQQDWDDICFACVRDVRGEGARSFILSVTGQWRVKRKLSHAQKDALLKFYNRLS